jgi:hypothetical protein
MVEYDLVKNEWLQGLYKIRESWIPVYNRNTFFAGMNTTQRSESINAFFDSFVDSSTTLQDFVVKFDKAVDSRYENEKKEDFESRHRERILSIGSKIEEHAASFYTRTIFNKFQDELAKVCRFTREKVVKSGSQYTYKVTDGYDSRDSFIVSVDLDTRDAKCGCQLFEFMGILCRHILVIFQAKNIVEIPSKYILHRWTKDANKSLGFIVRETNLVCDNGNSAVLRSMHVHNQVSRFPDLAAKSERVYNFISSGLEQLYKEAMKMHSEMQTSKDDLHSKTSCPDMLFPEQVNEEAELTIRDPVKSQTKGRQKDDVRLPKSGRIKSSLELSMNRLAGKRRNCLLCDEPGHNRRTCKLKTNEEEANSST